MRHPFVCQGIFYLLGRFFAALSCRQHATNWRKCQNFSTNAGKSGFAGLVCAVIFCATPAASKELIRCPDWRALVHPAHLLTDSERAEQTTFERRIAQISGQAATPRPERQRRAAGSSPSAACAPHVIRAGDTLSAIAATRLGSARRWQEIRNANPGTDPAKLRIGATLRMPCAARPAANDRSVAGAGKEGQAGAGKPATTPAATAPAKTETPAKPANPPLPVWTARKGEDFAAVLQRWGKTAGYSVVIETTDAWTIGVPVSIRASFEDAVAEIVRGLASGGSAPPVRLYANKVVRLGFGGGQ